MKRVLQLAVVAALTVFFLWLFLRNANLSEVAAILRKSSFGWVLLGFAFNITALITRTVRWRTLLDPDDPPPFYATFFANAVGYMASIVLPIRASDLARPALLSRRTSHRFSGALGTILTERVLDLTGILTMFVFFAALRWNEFSHDPAIGRWFYIVRAGAIAVSPKCRARGCWWRPATKANFSAWTPPTRKPRFWSTWNRSSTRRR